MKLLDPKQAENVQVAQKADNMARVLALQAMLRDEETKLKAKIAEVESEQRRISAAHNDFLADYNTKISPLRKELEMLEKRKSLALEPIGKIADTSKLAADTAKELVQSVKSALVLFEKSRDSMQETEKKLVEQVHKVEKRKDTLDILENSLRVREKGIVDAENAVSQLRITLQDGNEQLRNALHDETGKIREKIYATRDAFIAKSEEREKKIVIGEQMLATREKGLESSLQGIEKREAELWALQNFLADKERAISDERKHLESQQQALRQGFEELKQKQNGK